MAALKVLIAGGGIGGLALAHGLRRHGISVRLFERQVSGVTGGYRLHMNGDGGEALRVLLPEDLFGLYLDTSRTDPIHERLLILSSQLKYLASRPHVGPRTSGRRKDTAVNRLTLRQIMLTDLDDVIENAEVESYEDHGDFVEVVLGDGRRERGDILVGFDGIHSKIRTQLLPEATVVDTGLSAIYARSPLPAGDLESVPKNLLDGFIVILGPRMMENGVLAIGAFTPRENISEAAAARGVSTLLDAVEPYMMLGASIPPAIFRELNIDPQAATPEDLKLAMTELVREWDENVIGLVERAPAEGMFATRVRYIDPPSTWEASRVTLAGDAIHGMPPTLGVGANLALHDARLLSEALSGLPDTSTDSVLAAVAGYEEAMRARAFPLLRRAATQEGMASGFSPAGLVRLVRMVGLRTLIRVARTRDQSF